jgi:hypothetical protein
LPDITRQFKKKETVKRMTASYSYFAILFLFPDPHLKEGTVNKV